MKQESPPLVSFIKDYGLEKPNGVICFSASIHFHSKKNWFKFVSPVHIISISNKHMDVIYLLNPDIDEKKINTMFTNSQRFNYSETKRFEIKGKSKIYGQYSLFIIPISKSCEEATMTELQSKTFN
ncbi:MAG TPA: hypothetical protein VK489_14895 [Ferruginibacter sp.]|nr:hypothetical protein [Ferruginibacter sp.]